MSKVVLNDVASLQNETTALAQFKANNDITETAFDNTLSRDGSIPNQMNADLDMNSNRILNLPAPLGQTEPLRLEDLNTFLGIGTQVTPTSTTTFTNKTISGAQNTFSSIPISALASEASNTLLGNPTSASAIPIAFSPSGLTQKVSPVAGDIVLIQDSAASNAMKWASVGSIATISSGSVTTVNGQTGAVVVWAPPGGRLTLVTATPVMTSSQAAKTRIYYTPAVSNQVPLYDGTFIIPTVFSEIFQDTTDTTKSPAAVTANSAYDLFVWNDSGTIRLSRGPVWTDVNTPSAGSNLVTVNGVTLNGTSITNGPAAQRGTYVGSIFSDGSSQVNYIFGGTGSGGVAGLFSLWNAYNQIPTTTTVLDNQTIYTFGGASIRQSGGSTGNQVTFMQGRTGFGVEFYLDVTCKVPAVVGAYAQTGVGFDTTTAFSRGPTFFQSNGNTLFDGRVQSGVWAATTGKHFISSNQWADVTNVAFFEAGPQGDSLTVTWWN